MRISVVVPALVSLLIPLAAPAGPAQAADSARLQAQVNRAAASGQDCAVLDGHRYCLGLGFTDQSEPEARASLARLVATRSARTTAEQTGDIDTAPGAERRTQADRRAEFASAAASLDKVRDLESTDANARTTYPAMAVILDPRKGTEQVRTYWCGPASMQMIEWAWNNTKQSQKYWAGRLGTTTSGSSVWDMVRVTNEATGWDREAYAGKYIVLNIGDYTFRRWMNLMKRHYADYRAPVILHPVLRKRYYSYLDDDASGHFQVGRGYDTRGAYQRIGYFEPWNQQRFDSSEPYIARRQWHRAYYSYQANQAHPAQNLGL